MKPDLSAYNHLPRFSDGRIDYRESHSAVGVNCFVTYKGKLLLVKRSNQVGSARGKWHVIAGYVDEDKPIKQKALEELKEETRISEEHIAKTVEHKPFIITGEREWIIYPVHVSLKKLPRISLDWEHTEYAWVSFDEVKEYDTLENFRATLRALKLF